MERVTLMSGPMRFSMRPSLCTAGSGQDSWSMSTENALAYEIAKAGLRVASEISVSLTYDQLTIEGAYRLDILVEDTVIVEIKAVEKVLPVHHSQLLTYLKLDSKPVGLFFNFNSKRLSEGIKRMVNNL
jgi:GxxExxY protein